MSGSERRDPEETSAKFAHMGRHQFLDDNETRPMCLFRASEDTNMTKTLTGIGFGVFLLAGQAQASWNCTFAINTPEGLEIESTETGTTMNDAYQAAYRSCRRDALSSHPQPECVFRSCKNLD